jgi:hypothetical protein
MPAHMSACDVQSFEKEIIPLPSKIMHVLIKG